MSKKEWIVEGIVQDESITYTLMELADFCNADVTFITEMVEYGILEPKVIQQEDWIFSAHALIRVQKALRLQRDLSVNLPGVALALELLDEVSQLRARLQQIQGI